MISDSAAMDSPTHACAANFQMPRTWRVIATSSRRASPGTTGFLKRALSIPTKNYTERLSGLACSLWNVRIAAAWAMHSMMSTPGITG